jgi:hypothetical protein
MLMICTCLSSLGYATAKWVASISWLSAAWAKDLVTVSRLRLLNNIKSKICSDCDIPIFTLAYMALLQEIEAFLFVVAQPKDPRQVLLIYVYVAVVVFLSDDYAVKFSLASTTC